MSTATGELRFREATALVAKREITQRIREKSFFISFAITVAIILAVILIAKFAGGTTTYDVGITPSAGISADAVRSQAKALDIKVKVSELDEPAARSKVKNGDLDSAWLEPGAVLAKKDLPDSLRPLLEQVNRQTLGADRLESKGIDPRAVDQAFAVPALRVDSLEPTDKNADERRRIAQVGTYLLYGQLIGYATWVALGIVEEKSSRVIEVLLATVPARALLAGKVLGIGVLGLIQLLAVAAVGVTAALLTGTIDGSANALLPVALVLGWFLLGYAFYATAYAAAAARVSRQEDLQNVTTPMTLLIVLSFFGALWAGSNTDSTLARILGVVPPFSALVNPQRVAGGDAAGWEAPLSIVLMLAAISGLVVVGSRLYEGAVLHSGSVVSWRTAWKAERTG